MISYTNWPTSKLNWIHDRIATDVRALTSISIENQFYKNDNLMWMETGFVVPMHTARYGWFVPIQQYIGTQTALYQAIPITWPCIKREIRDFYQAVMVEIQPLPTYTDQ